MSPSHRGMPTNSHEGLEDLIWSNFSNYGQLVFLHHNNKKQNNYYQGLFFLQKDSSAKEGKQSGNTTE